MKARIPLREDTYPEMRDMLCAIPIHCANASSKCSTIADSTVGEESSRIARGQTRKAERGRKEE